MFTEMAISPSSVGHSKHLCMKSMTTEMFIKNSWWYVECAVTINGQRILFILKRIKRKK